MGKVILFGLGFLPLFGAAINLLVLNHGGTDITTTNWLSIGASCFGCLGAGWCFGLAWCLD